MAEIFQKKGLHHQQNHGIRIHIMSGFRFPFFCALLCISSMTLVSCKAILQFEVKNLTSHTCTISCGDTVLSVTSGETIDLPLPQEFFQRNKTPKLVISNAKGEEIIVENCQTLSEISKGRHSRSFGSLWMVPHITETLTIHLNQDGKMSL